jgi:hypothetical protein
MEQIMNANTMSASRQARLTTATIAARAAAVSACLLSAACASLQPTHTGFLSDYDSMQPNTAQPSEGAFRKSGLEVGHYRAFMIAPVVFKSTGHAEADPKTEEALATYYQEALRSVFAKHLEQVNEPGPDVLMVRAAVTGVRQAYPVVNAIAMAAVFVPVTAGAASSEAEVVDSVSGERLAALQGVTNGGRAFLGGPVGYLESYGQARRALTRQADHLATVLFASGRGPLPASTATAALARATADHIPASSN